MKDFGGVDLDAILLHFPPIVRKWGKDGATGFFACRSFTTQAASRASCW